MKKRRLEFLLADRFLHTTPPGKSLAAHKTIATGSAAVLWLFFPLIGAIIVIY